MRLPLVVFGVVVTLGAYVLSRMIGKRYPSPFTTPVFFSTPIVIATLLATGVSLEDYKPAKDLMVFLLGPATVALAVPLHKNWRTLAENALPALVGLGAGSLSTLLVAAGLAKVCGLSPVVIASIAIKSVTAPIAVELAPIVHGDPTLAAGFVIATGMIGVMLGPWLMNLIGIRAPLARGLALGTISHGQGTAQALREGELQGAVAGIAMALAAVLTSFVGPAALSLVLPSA
jgi:putative effector of murein hydrolase